MGDSAAVCCGYILEPREAEVGLATTRRHHSCLIRQIGASLEAPKLLQNTPASIWTTVATGFPR